MALSPDSIVNLTAALITLTVALAPLFKKFFRFNITNKLLSVFLKKVHLVRTKSWMFASKKNQLCQNSFTPLKKILPCNITSEVLHSLPNRLIFQV